MGINIVLLTILGVLIGRWIANKIYEPTKPCSGAELIKALLEGETLLNSIKNQINKKPVK